MLSPAAQQCIQDYLNLPCSGMSGIRCPYLNNARQKRRGELRALVGKGTPQEIIEEANIISTQYKAGIFNHQPHQCLCELHTDKPFSTDDIRHFLIDHSLGIECSGFVTQVLNKHFLETKGINLSKKMFITKRPLRWLISRLRPVENIDVRTYASTANTKAIANDTLGWDYSKVEPGDVIVILETGPRKNHNHIILITEIQKQLLKYVHARAWASEGEYGHGVTKGAITITKPNKHLREQIWTEKGITGPKNETWQEVAEAKTVEIRRINL
jgi:hypothetical protein